MFHHQRRTPLAGQTKSLKDLSRMIPAAQFLADEKRQVLLQKMKEYSGLEPSRYEGLCHTLVEHLVNYCQSLPETANSYYSQPGGLVDHALNRTEAALGLFKEFIIQEPEERLSEEQKLWQYALYSAAIVQGIGKLFVDFRINLFDNNGHLLKQWNPLLESLSNTGRYYDYHFQKEPEIEFRRRLNLLIARAMMPSSGFSWIASNPQVLAVWLALLNEDERSAGTLGAILIRADAIAIQRYFAEFMLRTGAGRGGHYGRSRTFAEGTPESLEHKELSTAIEFIQWLNNALAEGLIMINKPPLFMVPGGMLMNQEMFQLFVREHPEYKNWQAVQNAFQSLGLHRHGLDGSAISRFEQTHNQQIHTGIVFSDYAVALPETVKVHQMNTGQIESMSATEFVHKAQFNSQFTQAHPMLTAATLQQLSAKGQWQQAEAATVSQSPGVRRGV